jgi:hypothetical protein
MTPPPHKSRSPSPTPERCFCGAPQAPELEYYCSIRCAREDALNALTLGTPYTSDRPPTPPLPTLPPDFFKPPILRRRSYNLAIPSNGSDQGFPFHVDLGPFALPPPPRSKPNATAVPVPGADNTSRPRHISCSSTKSSDSDKPQWKSHYRRLREKESLHSISDAIAQSFQNASATDDSTTDGSIGSSSAVSSSSSVNRLLRGSFGQTVTVTVPTATDLDFFESSPLQNPRKPMPRQETKTSTRPRSSSRQTSTTSSASSVLYPTLPPGISFATKSPASRHRALGSAFGIPHPEPSPSPVDVHVTANETPAALRRDLRISGHTRLCIESSPIELDNTPPLEHPLPPPPPPNHPSKGGTARLFLPLRQTASHPSLSSQNPLQRPSTTTNVGLPTFLPTVVTATQPSTRPGVVVRQSLLLSKRRLPIGGGPTKPSKALKPGHSRANVILNAIPQSPVRGTGDPKPLSPSAIKVEDAPSSDAKSDRSSVSTEHRHRTVTSTLQKTPSPNTPLSGVPPVSVTPRAIPTPSPFLESPIVQEEGREMDDFDSLSTSECPVTLVDSAVTLGDSRSHPGALSGLGRSTSKRSMEESYASMFNLHRRFESGMDLDDEATPIGEKGFVVALRHG